MNIYKCYNVKEFKKTNALKSNQLMCCYIKEMKTRVFFVTFELSQGISGIGCDQVKWAIQKGEILVKDKLSI